MDNYDILGLPPGLVIVGRETDEANRTHFLYAEIPEVQMNCKCGAVDNFQRFGFRNYIYRDCPVHQYRVAISLKAQRFRCKNKGKYKDIGCGAIFRQQVEGMDPLRSMTTRCVEMIREFCLRDTFLRVAERIGCSERTVRDIAYAYILELEKKHLPYLPKWLGIDETSLNGTEGGNCLVLVDIGQHKPIDLLPNDKKATLKSWLTSIKDSSDLRGVSMDMCLSYKNAIAETFPNVPVVIDRWHVVRKANDGLDSVRNKLAAERLAEARQAGRRKTATWIPEAQAQSEKNAEAQGQAWKRDKGLLLARGCQITKEARLLLSNWLSNEPVLQKAYLVKEDFCNIYDLVYKVDAEIALQKWVESVPDDMRESFGDLLSCVNNWKEDIVAYFDITDIEDRKTNAYTEGFNSVLQAENRAGRGYTFEVLRARLLFGRRPHLKTLRLKKRKPKVDGAPDKVEAPEVAGATPDEAAAITEVETDTWDDVMVPDYEDPVPTRCCDCCGARYNLEDLEHYETLPWFSDMTGDLLGEADICRSCYERLSLEGTTDALPVVRVCDLCGVGDALEDLIFCDTPSVLSDTGNPIGPGMFCDSCVRKLEWPNDGVSVSTCESEASYETQAMISTTESVEPKLRTALGATSSTSCTGSDQQSQPLISGPAAAKHVPTPPGLARDIRRAACGLPPDHPPLRRKHRKQRKRWKAPKTD